MRSGRPLRAAALAAAVLLIPGALPAPPPAATAPAGPPAPGDILVAVRTTTVRTRGSGNIGVDLPRGRAVRIVEWRPDGVLIDPDPADAAMLRSYGVRKIPRYTATPDQIEKDFLPRSAWTLFRDTEIAKIGDRWPDLTADQAAAIFRGDPFAGMTIEQAEAAVGGVILERSAGPHDAETWRIGAKSRGAELRLFTEKRERGMKAGSFEEYLKTRTRAVLRFRDGRLAAVDPP